MRISYFTSAWRAGKIQIRPCEGLSGQEKGNGSKQAPRGSLGKLPREQLRRSAESTLVGRFFRAVKAAVSQYSPSLSPSDLVYKNALSAGALRCSDSVHRGENERVPPTAAR